MLWLVVVSACLSMYGYFRSFYYSVLSPDASFPKTKPAQIATVRE